MQHHFVIAAYNIDKPLMGGKRMAKKSSSRNSNNTNNGVTGTEEKDKKIKKTNPYYSWW
jgi:chromatin remodeling complex protein RSC6